MGCVGRQRDWCVALVEADGLQVRQCCGKRVGLAVGILARVAMHTGQEPMRVLGRNKRMGGEGGHDGMMAFPHVTRSCCRFRFGGYMFL